MYVKVHMFNALQPHQIPKYMTSGIIRIVLTTLSKTNCDALWLCWSVDQNADQKSPLHL